MIELLNAIFVTNHLKNFTQKVRDHCHYTSQYRGPAHRNCNLRYNIPSHIPITFHNLSRYDAHLFVRELGKETNKVGVIAKNKEKYISFTADVVVDEYQDKGKTKEKKIQLRFIDSMRFMASSLDSLMNNLVKGGQKLTGFEDHSKDQYALLVRKGVYPYKYMTSWGKFSEIKLPPKEEFYSRLNMSSISDEDYEHAQKVWSEFDMKNLGEYHDLYLKTDVILLANLFEAFRDTCLEHYKLDLAHFYTSPGLAWKACLKKTGVKLELLTDPNMLLMFEGSIRGSPLPRQSITQAVHQHVKVNNKCMGDWYNLREESSFLQYLDANNLYGWTMSQPLPTSGFRWASIDPNEIDELTEWISHLVRHDKGYLLEVDVGYPKELMTYIMTCHLCVRR